LERNAFEERGSYFSAKPKSTSTGTGGSDAVRRMLAGLRACGVVKQGTTGQEENTLDVIVHNSTSMEECNCGYKTEEPGLGAQLWNFNGYEGR
jgi:hypothetical protein